MNQLNTLEEVHSQRSMETKGRSVALDAMRGLTMLLMASAGLRIGEVVRANPSLLDVPVGNTIPWFYWRYYFGWLGKLTPTWGFLKYHTDHVMWAGCSFWDLIQPSFMFLVGVAVPYSIASRLAKGQSKLRMFLHAAWRSVLLVALGVFLASNGRPRTNFLFTNVLAQIGLGYFFLFCLGWTKPVWQAVAAYGILFLYWLAFALYPAPPAGFDFATVGLPGHFSYHPSGFGAHWDVNTNLASAFDRWFLNLFPRSDKFVGEAGGYATLNFIPSLATMIFGLMTGTLLRSKAGAGKKLLVLLAGAAVGLGLGWVLDWSGICPSVKRIWTPSFALFSTGWVLVGLAFFYLVVDVIRFKAWTYPLLVIGANSILFYMMFQLWWGFFKKTTDTHLGWWLYGWLNRAFIPMLQASIMLLSMWLIAWWMYRRKVFVRI